ncbi:zinc finger protein Xfin-like [Uranotaenia lowii]|uniref:zinc finger protein Xfin-like n=1 Tax=Uranotaenia lowii TaxID=190385 RepID=UPI00247A6C20|nr:zinc finger protein Xfin-like [Uranotaenia lowii]XP_055591937.1 zinc finger protein Xfin-like [Uranotaenia lowii]XP_055591939.1 zinc finger protein Xfin-like [Uranotaenia lowii]
METRSTNSALGGIVTPTGPNICRICLTNGGPSIRTSTFNPGDASSVLESIFSTVSEYNHRSLYGIMLTVCSPLSQRDLLRGVPERICHGCKWRLLSAYDFYETCLRNDDRIRELTGAGKQIQDQIRNPGEPQVLIQQDDSIQDMTPDIMMDQSSSFMFDSNSYYPEAESTQFMDGNAADLLEEMPTKEPQDEAFFEEHYKLNDKGNHSCGICQQEFIYKSQCRSHILVKHDPSKPFKCDVCFITITTEMRLVRHKTIYHGEGVIKISELEEKNEGTDSWTCKICSKSFPSIIRYKKHKGVHVAHNRPFKCDVCLYRFSSKSQLRQHSKLHQDEAGGGEMGAQLQTSEADPKKCDYCEEKLTGKRAMTMHVRRFHPQELMQAEAREKNNYKCIICSEAFARESVLNTHMKMHELMAMEKSKEQNQVLEALVKKELKEQRNSMDVAQEGPMANDGMGNNTSLKKKSDVDVLFVCMVCQQEFEERGQLLKHQKKSHSELHLNIVSSTKNDSVAADNAEEANEGQPNESPTYDESMVIALDPSQLLGQSMPADGSTRLQPVVDGAAPVPALPKCDLCGKTFIYNCLLQTHLKKSHSESKPFECKVCHQRFGYRGTLQKHELTHSAQHIKPGDHGSIMFKCKICSAKFLELKQLSFHLKSHRNEGSAADKEPTRKVEIFKCSHCPQIFSDRDQFDEHLVQAHQQAPIPQQNHHPTGSTDTESSQNRPRLDRPMNEKEMFFDSLSIVKLERVSDSE